MNKPDTIRQRQAQERRVQLIDTALGVFAEKGVEAATVKDLSEAAGVAQGLLYHYFRSKEDLLHAALDRHYFLPELRRIVSPDRGRPASDVLFAVVASFAAVLREHRPLLQVMAREAPSDPVVAERLERGRREGVRLLAGYLDSRVTAGELRPHDSTATAWLLLSTVVMAELTGAPNDHFLPAVVDAILHGILVDPPADEATR